MRKKNLLAKTIGITAAAATGAILYNKISRAANQDENHDAEQLEAAKRVNKAIDHIVDRTLIDSRKVLSDAVAPVQIKLGHEREGSNGAEPMLTLEFVDADNMKVEVPYPKHELVDNIGKLSRVADHLSNIFEKEFEYIA